LWEGRERKVREGWERGRGGKGDGGSEKHSPCRSLAAMGVYFYWEGK